MMNVFIVALGVGGATMLGGVTGYFIKYNNQKIDGAIFSFAAGIMIAASFSELILPCVEEGFIMFISCLAGITAGGALIEALQLFMPVFEKKLSKSNVSLSPAAAEKRNGALLFVAAIAVHNLPEGLAAGVGLGTGDMSKAVTIAAGIALQNIPEGIIVIPPLVHSGVSRKKAVLVSLFTGVIEVIGTFIGYYTAAAADNVMPVILCAAGGTMLYIICTDVICEACEMAGKKASGFSFLAGCCAMLIMDRII